MLDTKRRGAPIYTLPPREAPVGGGETAVRDEFGRRLHALLVQHGYSQSELAKRATQYMASGRTLGRDSISKYVAGSQLPNQERLVAIAKAFGVEPTELMPAEAVRSDTTNTPLSMHQLPNGNVWIRLNREVSGEVALKIMALLHADTPE